MRFLFLFMRGRKGERFSAGFWIVMRWRRWWAEVAFLVKRLWDRRYWKVGERVGVSRQAIGVLGEDRKVWGRIGVFRQDFDEREAEEGAKRGEGFSSGGSAGRGCGRC